MTFSVNVNNVKTVIERLSPNMGKKQPCFASFHLPVPFSFIQKPQFNKAKPHTQVFKVISVNACAASNTFVWTLSFLVGCLADSDGGVASGWPHFWFIGPEWGNYEAPSVTAQKFENLGCHWTDEWRAGRGSACPPPSYVTVQSDEKPCLLLCLHRPKESGGILFFTQAARGRNRVSRRGEAPMATAYQILFNFI